MDSLDLHLESEVVLPYKLYLGRVQENLLQLLSEQRQPMGAWDFTQRLKEVEKNPEVLESWNNLCPILGDAIAIRHKMFLSHAYDHRVVDGALGGMFVRKVADYLEEFDINREF